MSAFLLYFLMLCIPALKNIYQDDTIKSKLWYMQRFQLFPANLQSHFVLISAPELASPHSILSTILRSNLMDHNRVAFSMGKGTIEIMVLSRRTTASQCSSPFRNLAHLGKVRFLAFFLLLPLLPALLRIEIRVSSKWSTKRNNPSFCWNFKMCYFRACLDIPLISSKPRRFTSSG